ncbi:MAG: phosphoribosyltransferase family protein [Thermofilaceae archaeon]|nr:phosphoribosyltransferase family protein [Thermofilaceae archaeon]
MRKLEAVKAQLLAIEALKSLRRVMSGKEVLELLESKGLRITQVDLSRYVTGTVLPSPARSMKILKLLSEANVLGLAVKQALVMDERGVVNVTRIAYDTAVLGLAAARAYTELNDLGVTKVLTAAVNGIPLAVKISHVLDADLCVARQEPDVSSSGYLEVRYFAPDPPRYAHLYLPSFALREGDSVLIVDDLLRSGRTLKALTELASQKRANVKAVFTLVAIGENWRSSIPRTASKILVALEVKET